jgi:hypothetical protein
VKAPPSGGAFAVSVVSDQLSLHIPASREERWLRFEVYDVPPTGILDASSLFS